MYTAVHICMYVHVCEIPRNVFLNFSPPFLETGLKLAYLGGMTVVSPRDPPALLPRVGIEHVMG